MTSVWREGRAILILALPLIAGQVSQMLMGVIDTFMIGNLGTVELAAATLGHTILQVPLMLGIGIAIAVSIRVSQARGKHDPSLAERTFQLGFLLSLALGVVTILASLGLIPLLPYLGQDPAVVHRTPTFLILVGISMIPALATMSARSFADAMARPWTPFWIILAGVFLNIGLNWLLIHGKLGFPQMGLEGAGLATLLSRLASFLGLIYWLRQDTLFKKWLPEKWLVKPQRPSLANFWSLAWPASLQISAEMGAFIAAAFLVGSLGAAALAAHQIAIICVSTIFMFPLGISMALTVQIGEAHGAGNHEQGRPILIASWLMGLLISFTFITVFTLFHDEIPPLFNSDPETIEIASGLFLVAALFTLGDYSQVLSSGVLRGLDDVKKPALIILLAQWAVGIPLGAILAFHLGIGADGIWWGLSIGLNLCAVLLGIRAWKLTGNA